jgi:hypothetical protein
MKGKVETQKGKWRTWNGKLRKKMMENWPTKGKIKYKREKNKYRDTKIRSLKGKKGEKGTKDRKVRVEKEIESDMKGEERKDGEREGGRKDARMK